MSVNRDLGMSERQGESPIWPMSDCNPYSCVCLCVCVCGTENQREKPRN